MQIRRLCESDAAALWALRLEALEAAPSAFAESAEEHRHTSVESYAARLHPNDENSFVVGAIEAHELIGMAGFFREQRIKRRHKGTIWGVFVSGSNRRRGIGRNLLENVISTARYLPGLTQIQLSVSIEQPRARELYASLNFRSYGIEPAALKVGDRYVDEEHMVLSLNR